METYKVQKGDTLGGIAEKYNVSLDDISGYRSGNVNLIYPNETLNIKKKVKWSELDNIPQVTVNNSGAVDSPDNYPAPAYNFNPTSNNDSNMIKSSFNNAVNRENTLRSETDRLTQDLTGLYNQRADSIADVYGMDKSDDIKLQLDKIMADRANIENQAQLNAEGRGITEEGLQPLTTSQLRRNTIQANQKLAEYNYQRGLTENSLADIDRVIDAKFKPLEIQMKYKEQQYNDIYRTFSNKQSAYASSLANMAKLKISEMEQDKARLDKEKQIETFKNRLMLSAKGNGAPASVLDAINNATSPKEMLKVSGRYGLSTTMYSKKYYPTKSRRTTTTKTTKTASRCEDGKVRGDDGLCYYAIN